MPDRVRLLPRRRPLRRETPRDPVQLAVRTRRHRAVRIQGNVADHTEIVTAYHGGELLTIGGNSGPSNVDDNHGQGGVHRHRWNAPAGHGNPAILTVINASKVVRFGGPAHLTRPGTALPDQPRQLMLKTPMMHGADVRAVQQALNQRGHAGLGTDGTYGPATRDAVMTWQQREHIHVDGIVGPQTRSSLGLPTAVPVPG